MNKAEEKALEAYPPEMRKAFELLPKDWNKPLRTAYVNGYKQAEEDLANAAALSSGPDGFYYGKGYQQGKKDAEKHLGWHSVEESLPPIDEEVIVLTDEMHGKKLLSACHISYGHRPNPDGWDGKSIFTGKVTHHDVVTYDGWNIPGVKYWMPMPKIPKEDE
jgi:hypothetical protein